MSRIESYLVRTNFNKKIRALKIDLSSQDRGTKGIHDKVRGGVIASARLLCASLLNVFPASFIPTGSGRIFAIHHVKFAKYLLTRMNLSDCFQRIVNHNLNVVANHIHAFLTLPGFITSRCEHCDVKNICALRKFN